MAVLAKGMADTRKVAAFTAFITYLNSVFYLPLYPRLLLPFPTIPVDMAR